MSTAALAGHHPRLRWKSLQPRMPDYDDPGFEAARRAWLAWWEFGQAMGYGASDGPDGIVPAPLPLTPFEPPFSMFGKYPLTVPAGSPGTPRWAVMSLRFPPQWSHPGYQHLVRAGDQWRDILPGLQCRVGGLVAAGRFIEPGFDEAIVHFRLTPGPGSDDPA